MALEITHSERGEGGDAASQETAWQFWTPCSPTNCFHIENYVGLKQFVFVHHFCLYYVSDINWLIRPPITTFTDWIWSTCYCSVIDTYLQSNNAYFLRIYRSSSTLQILVLWDR